MSNFVIAAGHTASGNIGCGVIADLHESVCTREISQLVGKELERKGHKLNVLIIDKSNSYNCEDCFVRTKMANELNEKEKVDLYVEIHINAGGGTGTEVLITNMVDSPIAEKYAEKISKSVSSALGIRNRGVKKQSLIVLNKTSMPAILIECLFADSSDSEKYNAEVIAGAIADVLDVAENKSSRWKPGWNRNEIGMWFCADVEKGYYYTANNGWKYIDGDWYIFDQNGYALQSKWYYYKNDEHWYYLDESCKMVYGKDKPLWKWINGGCYAFDKEGRLVLNL
ncbi:hypothetical protein Q604_UNBC18379G0004 [human gut metagenome]|uniref:MurNAc-LAA domain-containing protein n=1 Tax=human gut metagenome TaxID=408170 RepID=W1WUQ5_9ZZZZ